MKSGKGKPNGPYQSSVIGRCCCVFDRKTGTLLRVMPNRTSAGRWVAKHSLEISEYEIRGYASVGSIRRVFDDQMRIGLTSRREISDLLWYGAVSSDWKGPSGRSEPVRKRNVKSGHD